MLYGVIGLALGVCATILAEAGLLAWEMFRHPPEGLIDQ